MKIIQKYEEKGEMKWKNKIIKIGSIMNATKIPNTHSKYILNKIRIYK